LVDLRNYPNPLFSAFKVFVLSSKLQKDTPFGFCNFGYNQLMVAPNITQFNIPGLTALTGTYKTVSAIDTVIAAINAPNFFWFTAPTLSGTENNFNPIPWEGKSTATLQTWTTTGMWTCPAAGLWQFTFSIFYEGYLGYLSWSLYQNGKGIALIEQPSNGTQYITSLGTFITPAKACNTFQWLLNFE